MENNAKPFLKWVGGKRQLLPEIRKRYPFEIDKNINKYLASFYREMSNRGAYVLESNSDPKYTNPTDTFFDDLYSDFTIDRVQASRSINSVGSLRKPITEILIRNY
jgi:DNA adenine methylase